jgi:two-component system response regulator (stage 0 sporulation protein F)
MKKQILIIDDEEEIRELLQEILAREGCLVATASSGAEARRIAAETPPDLIICDLQLEDTDGLALITEFKQAQPALPAILLTGVIFDPETVQETFNRQGVIYISKTAPLLQIRAEVQRLLAKPPGRGG